MKNRSMSEKRKLVGRVFWIAVAAISVIWMISQQVTINKYTAEVAELKEEKLRLKEINDELSTSGELTEEEFEREARKYGYVRPEEVILKEAE